MELPFQMVKLSKQKLREEEYCMEGESDPSGNEVVPPNPPSNRKGEEEGEP